MDRCKESKGIVRLINAVFYAHHGVHQEEHKIGGRYEVDVALYFDFSEAARTDSLESTVDYARTYQVIESMVVGRRYYLIERLAFEIAHGLLEQFTQLDAVEVTVRKHNPPVGGTCDRAEAIYRCERR